MSFWLREIVGWLMVVIGSFLLLQCYLLVKDKAIFEAGPLSVIAIIVFRGGIHLLKVAIAARICREARERSKPRNPAAKPARPAAKFNPLAVR